MRGHTDDRAITEQTPGGGGRDIVLSNVRAGSPRQACDIQAIVDDDRCAVRRREPNAVVGEAQECRGALRLGAELYHPRSAIQEGMRDVERGTAGACRRLDIDDRVIDLGSPNPENFGKGIMGMAFDPNYFTNGYFYLHYYKPVDFDPIQGSDGVIARYQVTADPNVADHDR